MRRYGPRKRTHADMLRGACSLLLNARDLDRIPPEMLVRCHGVKTIAAAEQMLAQAKARRVHG